MSRGRSRHPTHSTLAKAPSGRRHPENRSASPASGVWQPQHRNPVDSPLLLDTHIWLWMLEGDTSRLSPAVIQLLKDGAKEGSLLVSDISFWEVANKSAKGKLSLSIDAVIWLEKAGSAPGVSYVPIERSALIQSTRLRGEAAGDPADRILLATAQLNGASLVTCDAAIIEYARRERGISVCDARH